MNYGRVGEVVRHVGGNAVASEGVLRHVHPLGDSPRRCLADGGVCAKYGAGVWYRKNILR